MGLEPVIPNTVGLSWTYNTGPTVIKKAQKQKQENKQKDKADGVQ